MDLEESLTTFTLNTTNKDIKGMSKEQIYDEKHNAAADAIHTWFVACMHASI